MLDNDYFINTFVLIAIALVFYFKRLKFFEIINIYDIPDGKLKRHLKKASLFGGVIFITYLLIIFILDYFEKNGISSYLSESEYVRFSFLFSSISFFLIGVYDDKYHLNYQIKIFLFCLIIYICLSLDPGLIIKKIEFTFTDKVYFLGNLSKFFTILCIFIFINALNLYDGIDLQSGLYIFIIFFTLGTLTSEIFFFYLLIPTLLFLILNQKKEIFMGDNGTILVGFLISYFVIKTYKTSIILSDEIFILMMLPGIDMLRLFLFRTIKGKNPFIGDSNHIHHLLVNKFGNIKTIIILNGIIVLSILSLFILKINSLFIISLVLIVYLFLVFKK
tara:strand:+ start:1734 stop:2732 length:999 start_codon:yes stop_codon:yes gene_type:complete